MRSRNVQRSRSTTRSPSSRRVATGAALALGIALALLLAAQPANAIGTTIGLGTATSYSVLGGASVTNTGASVLGGDLGVSPGTAISGFPPGTALGTTHQTDAAALQAQGDLTTAYNNAAGQASDASIAGDLGGLTLGPGVYTAPSSIGLTGTLTLDAHGDPNAVFIFQIGSALTTASGSAVALLNGAQSCNVFWQVASSATLGTSTAFVGTVMALTSITVNTGATVQGRALARNGSVTLDTNVFTNSACAAAAVVTATPKPKPKPKATAHPTHKAVAHPTHKPSPRATTPPALPAGTPPGGGNTPPNNSVLADTGSSLSAPLLGGAGVAILGGLGLIAMRNRRSRSRG